MIRRWNFFFVFCFFIHILVFAFFPRKHVVDRLPYALINKVLNDEPNASIVTPAKDDVLENLLLGVMELSEDFSVIEQPNFHLRPHRVVRYSFSVVVRVLKLVYLNVWVHTAQKPTWEYSNFIPLLPKYYTFLFRLTPF